MWQLIMKNHDERAGPNEAALAKMWQVRPHLGSLWIKKENGVKNEANLHPYATKNPVLIRVPGYHCDKW